MTDDNMFLGGTYRNAQGLSRSSSNGPCVLNDLEIGPDASLAAVFCEIFCAMKRKSFLELWIFYSI